MVLYIDFTQILKNQIKWTQCHFLEINLLDLNDGKLNELKKFQKENFDIGMILDTASELKYLGLIKNVLKNEFSLPSDEFVKLILNADVYVGKNTQSIIEKYRPLVKKIRITIY